MREPGSYRFWEVRRPYKVAVRIGLLTAGTILLFAMVDTLVIYRFMKLDLYLCLVAVFFLTVGLRWNKRKASGARQKGESMGSKDAKGRETGHSEPVSDGLNVLTLLSAKEWQILTLVAEGKTNKEIAAAQFIEVSTVKTHLNNIYGKLSVGNRKEARAKYALYAPNWPVSG